MKSVAEVVIKKCGGPLAVAAMLGLNVSRVYRFTYPRERGGTGGLIPANHQQSLLDEARKRGLNLRPSDFFASKRAAS